MRYFATAVFMICLTVITAAHAQDSGWRGVRVTWDENPEGEAVGWYIVQIQPSNGDWSEATNSNVCDSGECVATFSFASVNITPNIGTRFCVRIIAAKNSDRSEPSPQTCTELGDKNPTGTDLSRPAKPVNNLY